MTPYPGPQPGPYQPPQVNYQGHGPNRELLAPARRAAILMIVLGCLALALGGCAWLMSSMVNQIRSEGKLPAEQTQMIDQLEAQTGLPIKQELIYNAIGLLIPAIVLIGLGIPVRSGRKGWIIAALVVLGIGFLLLVVNLLNTFRLQAPLPAMLAGACMCIVGIGVLGLGVYWLIGALRNSGRLRQASSGHLQAYQAYQQHYQQYAQQYPQQQAQVGPPAGQPFWQPVPPPQQPQQSNQADPAYMQAYGPYLQAPSAPGLPPPPPPGQPPVSMADTAPPPPSGPPGPPQAPPA